jgi:hypothetical protein
MHSVGSLVAAQAPQIPMHSMASFTVVAATILFVSAVIALGYYAPKLVPVQYR